MQLQSIPAAAGRVRTFAWFAALVIMIVVLVMMHGWK